jgi:hypothetical protein
MRLSRGPCNSAVYAAGPFAYLLRSGARAIAQE